MSVLICVCKRKEGEERRGVWKEEEKQVRHRSLVSAICSQSRQQGDKRKKQRREEGSAAGKVHLPVNQRLFWPEL